MTSIRVAPRPIRTAHLNPRRAPSLRMVKLIGPTGMDRIRPAINPVSAAMRIGGRKGMPAGTMQALWRASSEVHLKAPRRDLPPHLPLRFPAAHDGRCAV